MDPKPQRARKWDCPKKQRITINPKRKSYGHNDYEKIMYVNHIFARSTANCNKYVIWLTKLRK